MSWRFDKASPVFMQIADTVRKRIVCGTYAKGSQLPSVRELAVEAAVNPNTVQKAFLSLEGNGLIETLGTQGRFVTDNDEKIRNAKESLAFNRVKTYFEEMEELGFDARAAAALADNYLQSYKGEI